MADFLIIALFVAAALAAIGAAAIVARRRREIRLLDPDTIREEVARQKRDALIAQRFDRITSERLAPLRLVAAKVGEATRRRARSVYLSVIRLEKYYKQAKAPFAAMAPSVRDRVKVLLGEARSLARDLKWADAERRYLEVLAIDPRHWDAYKGLGQIYLAQRLWPQAKETFQFLLKSKKADDAVFAALAEIAEAEKDLVGAEDFRKKAVAVRPRLAHRQAELAEFYLDREDPAQAWAPAKLAAELDEKSPKYLELSLDVALRLKEKAEAKKRYDKLRLLSQDRPKLQALKERLDVLNVTPIEIPSAPAPTPEAILPDPETPAAKPAGRRRKA